jgi:unsaturated chondroitin disaccharide hydrolase
MSRRIQTPDERASGIKEGQRLVGRTIGPNKLEELLDFSRKSWIFKGKDNLGRVVAVKVLKPGQGLAREKQLFEEEGPALAKLEACPHITTIYTAGQDPDTGLGYIATQYVDGRNLRTLVEFPEAREEAKRFSLEEISRIAYEVSLGIEAIHAQGLIHRDVKPSNVLIEKGTGKAFVIDLGGVQNTEEGVDDIVGVGDVLEYLIEYGEVPKPPKKIARMAKKARNGGYRTITDLRKDLASHIWWATEIKPSHKLPGITRRAFLRTTAAAAGLAATGTLSWAVKKYKDAMARVIEEIKEADPTDWATIDPLFKELDRRTFRQKVLQWDATIPAGEFPFGTDKGEWFSSPAIGPDNGYFPGIFWNAWRKTSDIKFKRIAMHRSADIQLTSQDREYVNAARFFNSHARGRDVLTNNGENSEEYKRQALQALNILAAKYNPKARFIPLVETKPFQCEAGIMLYVVPFCWWGYKVTDDPEYKEIAFQHVQTTISANIREDGSVRKTAVFDVVNDQPRVVGEVNSKGISGKTTLTRAQAQVIYGLVETLGYIQDPSILKAAVRTGDHYLERTNHGENIPFYDFSAPQIPETPTDTTAASITSNALLRLSNITGLAKYGDAARVIRKALVVNYHSTDPDHEGILMGGCHNFPGGEYVRSSLICGDYYYLES